MELYIFIEYILQWMYSVCEDQIWVTGIFIAWNVYRFFELGIYDSLHYYFYEIFN